MPKGRTAKSTDSEYVSFRRLIADIASYHESLPYKASSKKEAHRNACLGLIVECNELLDTHPWKPWRDEKPVEGYRELLAEEAADVLIMLCNVIEAADIDPATFEDAIYAKLAMCKARIIDGYHN